MHSISTKPGFALALLIGLPALMLGGRAQAGYVSARALSHEVVSAVAGGAPEARVEMETSSGDLGSFSASEKTDAPMPLSTWRSLFLQTTHFALAASGGMTPPDTSFGSGAGGHQVGLPSEPQLPAPEPGARLRFDEPVFAPTPAVSGLFRPPRARV